jgi:hypothetical protein
LKRVDVMTEQSDYKWLNSQTRGAAYSGNSTLPRNAFQKWRRYLFANGNCKNTSVFVYRVKDTTAHEGDSCGHR